MADFTVRYADWKGGDWGVRDPAKADSDQYSGTNVLPYSAGLLGVRSGLKQVAVTGLPTHPIVPGPLGFWSFGPNLVIVLGRPYQFPATGGAATAWALYPAQPSAPVRFLTGAGIAYSLWGGALYKHPNATTTTVVTTPAPLSTIVRWGYYFVGVDANIPWRIWFSTVDATGAHYDQWGANDYIDIGTTEPITSLNPIFNTLYVGKASGWNAVSGVLGTLASLRGVALGVGPIDPRTSTVTTDNRILYWPKESRPAWFNGERVFIDSMQDIGVRSSPYVGDSVIVAPTARRLIMVYDTPGGTSALSWQSSAWSRHTFPAKLGALVPGNVIDGYGLPADVLYTALAPTTVGDPVVVASLQHQLDRPGHNSDAYSAPVDIGTTGLVTGTVDLPSYWEPIGRQVRVRSIIVQFRKWASGIAGTRNQVQMRLDAHGAYGRGPSQGETLYWDEPCERSSTSGTDESWRANVGSQGYGNGFQLHFTKLVGVALREVIVLCDVRTERM